MNVVDRANEILADLEKGSSKGNVSKPSVKGGDSKNDGVQLSFFQLDDPVLSQIRDEIVNIDVNNLTPVEALNKLNEIKRIIVGK